MPPRVTVVVPTLHAGDSLERTVRCLESQTFGDFITVIVDNGDGVVRESLASAATRTVIRNRENVGFGEAVNQGCRLNNSEYICALNDDAAPEPEWLARLVEAADRDTTVGMCASQIRLSGQAGALDSAGLAIYPDGTTKQRGHGEPSDAFGEPDEALLPSGCAALYRRAMLDQVGAFDPDYFLYCEDTDLGLRGRLAGWICRYVPSAVVYHEYSRSSGRASAMKALYVERNRLYTVVKNFPIILWPLAPAFSLWRYAAHAAALLAGRGLVADFGRSEGPVGLVGVVLSAHWQTLRALPRLLAHRKALRSTSKLGSLEFIRLLRRHRVSAWKIAAQ